MYIYESASNTSANIINSMYSVLVPSTHTEWIIGYNHTDNKSSFYCIGPVVKKRTMSIILAYALMIYIPTMQKGSMLTLTLQA